MSDDGSTAVEKKGRGRPKANGTQAEAKGDSKKRGRPAAPAAKPKESKNSSDDEQAPVVKRGRGRPKGTKKKAVASKAKQTYEEGGNPVRAPLMPSTSTRILQSREQDIRRQCRNIELRKLNFKNMSGEGRGRGRPRKDAAPPKKDAGSTEEEQDEDDEEEEGSDQ